MGRISAGCLGFPVKKSKTTHFETVPASLYRQKAVTEKEFLRQITELAGHLGWKTYHTWSSIHSAAGFPDLVLVRERLIVAELKTDKGKLSEFQSEWLKAFEVADVEWHIWRPENLDSIVQVLKRRVEKP